ncbi:hypothetical protein [Ornithinibacillus xuwenensis]|uniref:Uncharacterized protein n=1 Tax=Ornithinibacillus xuwenensis TaxID=3144668 RepID=A0ABU9XGD2_9BACI
MNSDTNELKIIKLLTPLINKALSQTSIQNREDLLQELLLMILVYLRKSSKELPSFFQLLEQESNALINNSIDIVHKKVDGEDNN